MESKLDILLIEDNDGDVGLFNISLKEAFSGGYIVSRAADLHQGLELLDKHPFDIVVLDLSLPDSFGLDGFKTLHAKYPEIPVIVLTGLDSESTGINAVKMGAQDFLIKEKFKSNTLKRSLNYSIERNKLLIEAAENARKLEERTIDLVREKQKLSEAQKLAHIGSWELDLNENTVALSEELQRILGVPPEKALISYDEFIAFVHPVEKQFLKISIDNSRKSLNPFSLYNRIIRPDGSVRKLHTRGEPLSDKQGKVVKMMGTGQDVTERFHEEELEKLASAATKSYNSVIIRDRNGKIEWVNDGFTKLSGYEIEEVRNTLGEILKNGNHPDILNQKVYYERLFHEKMPLSFESLNYSKNGQKYWAITTLSPVLGNDGELERIISIDTDITDRKQMEEDLVLANKISEHSLRKGNKALSELTIAKKQLEESMKVKEQFLANMSHEIRTPMNAIVGFTNLLQKTKVTPDQSQFIEAIKTSGENLLVIINDILDFSKIESGRITFEQIPLRLSTIIASLSEMMLPKSMEKNIRLSTRIDKKIPDNLIGDPTRLSQILLNLAGNAVKFTEKGEIRITVDLLEESKEAVNLKFAVSDTGIGIPQSKLNSIFEGFTQATNETTRKFGGTGLGLSIVKQLVELQGGSVFVESKLGEGSTFFFLLSLRKNLSPYRNENGKPNDETIDSEALNGVNLLLVEDNYLNQVLAKKVLTDWQLKVEVAENGLVAIEKLEKNDFDLVLMDIQLPEMDGYEATRHIRKKMKRPKSNVPIIAMTAHAISGEAEKCFEAGMDDYVSKPFDPKDLFLKMATVLKKKQVFPTPITQETTKEKKDMDIQKYTDLDYLKQLSNGSNEFVLQMINLFKEQTPVALAAIEKAFEAKDWKALRATVHKIKPSFGFMGISNLKALILSLEENAEKGINEEEMKTQIAELRKVCETALLELEEEIKVIT